MTVGSRLDVGYRLACICRGEGGLASDGFAGAIRGAGETGLGDSRVGVRVGGGSFQ